MDWLNLYCTHYTPIGWSDNNLIVHGLAGPELYPSLTGWPAVGHNPALGLRGTILGLRNTTLGLHGTNWGLKWVIYHLGSFFREILNMITINPALGLHGTKWGLKWIIYHLIWFSHFPLLTVCQLISAKIWLVQFSQDHEFPVLASFIQPVWPGLVNMVAECGKYTLAKQSHYICFSWYVVLHVIWTLLGLMFKW
jgi:hypothetical protein